MWSVTTVLTDGYGGAHCRFLSRGMGHVLS